MVRKLTPLTGDKDALARNFAKTFCATLPSEREVATAAKAFCATLPGSRSPAELTKAFCATLPSEKAVREAGSKIVRSGGQK